MRTYETLAVEHSHRATHTLLDNEHPDSLQPRSRPPRKSLTVPNLINTRYNTEEHPYGSPPINISDDKGRTRLAHDGDYKRRPLTGSESRGSEEESSIHRVDDLGFEAAAALFSAIPRGTSDCDSVLSSPIEDLFRERKLDHVFRSQVSSRSVSVQNRLQRKIERALVCCALDKQEYLPLDRFESIFDSESIAMLLQEACHLKTNEELRDKFAKIVDSETGRSRRRILGVLVFMSRVNYIDNFIQEDIWDINLPLERSASILNKLVRTRNSERAFTLGNWSRNEIELFFIYQKMLFVPFFDIKEHQLCSYDLGSDIRLPWKSFEHKTNGGFGAIHKVEIHSSHHNFARSNSGINPVFALKAIEAEDHKAYKEELSALEKTCARVQEEKHLIKLLLTFRHGDKFYLLFEWADGNLDEFWRTHSPGPRTSMRERWAAQQCLGLTRAVSRIHGLTTWQMRQRSSLAGSLMEAERDWGRHGDIKPENILWFEEYGNDHNLLVMSDLGLTRYHSQFSKSIVPRSHIDGHSWAYRPPELDMDERISQKYDIWSLGCVFLEFCVWYLQGHEEVELFSFQRIDEDLPTYEGVKIEKFFNIEKTEDGQKESHVKNAVEERLRTLKGLSDQSTFAKGLLRIIEEKMLQCAPKHRATIDRIKADLWNILESIPKESNPQELSQDLAYIRRDDSAPSLGAPRDLSLYEVAREPTIDDPDTTTEDGSDTDLVMPTRSQRLRRENAEQSEDRRDAAPSKDGQGNFGILAADATAETRPKETNDRLPHVVLGPEDGEAPHGDAASFHITGRSPQTTKTNKTKKRHIRQKSRKWFQDQLTNLNRMWKG